MSKLTKEFVLDGICVMAIDSEQWVLENFGDCELGDERRTKRLVKIAKHMLAAPDKSLPTQNCEWSDTKAAYRFFRPRLKIPLNPMSCNHSGE